MMEVRSRVEQNNPLKRSYLSFSVACLSSLPWCDIGSAEMRKMKFRSVLIDALCSPAHRDEGFSSVSRSPVAGTRVAMRISCVSRSRETSQ